MKAIRMVVLLAAVAPATLQGQPGAAPEAAPMTRAAFVAMVSDYFGWVHWSEYNDYAKPVPRRFADVRTGDFRDREERRPGRAGEDARVRCRNSVVARGRLRRTGPTVRARRSTICCAVVRSLL
jgi:hypothetical protein